MIEVELCIPDSADAEAVIRAVEAVCTMQILICTLKGSLVRYPGSIHWHYKKVKQKGTLEFTWWERQRRLWLKVARNRGDTWIHESMPLLKEQIEKALLLPDG